MEGVDLVLLLFCFLFIHKIYAAEFDIISDSQFLTDGDTLVSQTGIFELGFFQPNNSENRYLGIWYKKISVRTVVWVANRDHPLPSASPVMLKIVAPGNLVLFNNMSIIWSSNTTAFQNATANLLDSGNLVVTDQELFGNVLWQSFDYPTDTLLPTMRLGKDYSKGIEWRLSSWKSNEDPGPGEFTWEANTHGYPAFELKQRGVLKQRTAPWTNERFTFSGMLSFIVNVFITKTEASYAYHIENNTSILSRLTLNSSGKIVSTVWAEESKTWQRVLEFPNNICDNYNICGAYGSCSTVNMGEKSCACLDEYRFLPRDDDRSGGCVRRTPLDCRNGSEGFIKYSKIKLPDSQNAWFNTSMSLEECEAKCLQNCSCMAYTDTNIIGEGSTGCLMWFNDLIDIRVSTVTGRDIFVRIASSQIGSSNSSSDPAGSSNPTAKKKGGSKTKIILLVLFPGFLLIGFSITLLWYARVKKNKAGSMVNGKLLDVSESQEAMELPIFSFSRISNATTRFSLDNKIGEGGFGPVYKGVLEEGLEIAVKRLSRSSSQGVDEFKNEVICISKLQHRNLVKLLGCCIQGDEKLLIYEYMPNGSLDSFIFDKTKGMLLDWTKRFDIIKGISIGLVYLHRDSRLRIIHRDLKASNILLDVHMNPKISDFGMARSFGGNETQANTERVVGTYGYMSPEYALDGLFSIKSDVFSFGVLLLEIVSGKRNRGFIQPENQNNLIGHTWSLHNDGRSMELIDANLVESCNPSEVSRLIQVGLLCVQNNAGDRPNMPSVIQMLDGEGVLPQPKQPAFFIENDLLLIANFSSSTRAGGSLNGLTITEDTLGHMAERRQVTFLKLWSFEELKHLPVLSHRLQETCFGHLLEVKHLLQYMKDQTLDFTATPKASGHEKRKLAEKPIEYSFTYGYEEIVVLLTSTTHLDQFSLAQSGHLSLGPAKGCVFRDVLNFQAGKPVELSLMARKRWVSNFTANGPHGMLGLKRLQGFLRLLLLRNGSRIGINKWYQSFALRNFDLEDMELEFTKIKREVVYCKVSHTQTGFGGNAATKKTQKTLLKQQYENFSATSAESLDSIFSRV
ncbi:G-type lectin S-receptor-like serine/threonine-protein kinase [Tanacetum coccineum]